MEEIPYRRHVSIPGVSDLQPRALWSFSHFIFLWDGGATQRGQWGQGRNPSLSRTTGFHGDLKCWGLELCHPPHPPSSSGKTDLERWITSLSSSFEFFFPSSSDDLCDLMAFASEALMPWHSLLLSNEIFCVCLGLFFCTLRTNPSFGIKRKLSRILKVSSKLS